MTQMGLEYMKHKETGRHNLADEGIRQKSNVISQQDADTRKYVASFKPQEVDISSQQAKASLSQADTAKGRLSLDTQFRERETVAKEITADAAKVRGDASVIQAETGQQANIIRQTEAILKSLDPSSAAKYASQLKGDSEAMSNVEQLASQLWRIIEQVKGSVKLN